MKEASIDWSASGRSAPSVDGSCRARRTCVPRSIVACNAARPDRLASEVCADSCDAGRSTRCRAAPVACATGHCRSRGRQMMRAGFCRGRPAGVAALRGSSRALPPRAGLPPGRQSEGGLPEEDPCRRPPPSTSSPCPAWFFRLPRPFFRRSKTAVQKRFAPLQLLAFIQLAQKRPPDLQPNLLLLPVPQPPPAGRRRGKLLGQILPASPAAQNPQNAFQHFAVVGRRLARRAGVCVVSGARAGSSPTGRRSTADRIAPSALPLALLTFLIPSILKGTTTVKSQPLYTVLK